jgi:pSer/pThr/pTyr-binding forkhead associated (FHA) protein
MSMSFEPNGELVPIGGGDNIPLIRAVLTLGRRESCDICLRFPAVSGTHCELSFREGYWYIRDCNSTNGVKVNGMRVMEKLLRPRDEITIAKRRFVIEYQPPVNQRGALEEDRVEEDVFGQSLLEKAGLEKPTRRESTAQRRKSADDDALRFLLGEDSE